jgi:hypothetical protein
MRIRQKARVRTLVTQTLQAVVSDIHAEVDQGVADRIGYCPPPAEGLVAKSYAAHLPVQSPNRYRAIATATQEYWKRQGFAIVGAAAPVARHASSLGLRMGWICHIGWRQTGRHG